MSWTNRAGALVIFAAVACSGSPPAALFEPCMVDEDCDPRWECVPGASGPGGARFCSRECFSGPTCLSVVDGARDANYCLPYDPDGGVGACYMGCPDEGGSPEDGCEEFGVGSRRVSVLGLPAYCVCSP